MHHQTPPRVCLSAVETADEAHRGILELVSHLEDTVNFIHRVLLSTNTRMLVSSHSLTLKLLNSLHLIADARYPPEDFPSYLVFHLNALTSLTNVELLTFSSKKSGAFAHADTPPPILAVAGCSAGSKVTFPKHLISP